MIIEMFLNIVKNLLLFLISLFPALPVFEDGGNYLSSLANVIGYANLFCDLNIAFPHVVLCFIVCNARFIWGAIMWVVRKIPGVT